jgi:PAS domain S-box-containing protein
MLPEETMNAGLHLSPEKQQGFINALLENVEDGIVACDSGGVVTVFNHAARRMHGLSESSIAADHWAEYYDLYLPDGQTRMRKEEIPLFRALQGENVRNVEMVIAPKEGESLTVLASGGAVYGTGGEKLGAVVVLRDFSERKEAQEALRRESGLLHALMNNIPDAIYFKDTEGRFTRVNQHAPYRGNKAPEEVVGKTDFDFFVEEHARAAYEDEQRVIRTGIPILDKEEKETYTDGSMTWLSTTKVPVFDDEGRVTGIVGISRDITERKRAEEARIELAREQAARTEAENANRLKDEFLAILSHELRTPLTAVLGWSKMLIDGHVAENMHGEALTSIYRNAKSQAQLIEDLLDISRIITGRFRIEARPVELTSVVEAAVASVRPTAAAKSLTLQTKLDASAVTVPGDAERLQQVVWNLLTNAVKFTPKGGLVEVHLTRLDTRVEIAVSDTGHGIEPDFLPYVFERFRQADSSTTRRHGGLGLGLAIVSHLVELHGGTVHAESAGRGQGSTFRIVLPETACDSNGKATVEESAPSTTGNAASVLYSLEGLRVLAVDDEADARHLVSEMLAGCGAQVRTAASVGEAIEVLRLWLPDVLLADIGMPDGDGFALIKRVRALPAGQGGETPAAALTAYAGAEDRARVLSSGFQAHLTKPVEPAGLSAVIAKLAGRAAEPRS